MLARLAVDLDLHREFHRSGLASNLELPVFTHCDPSLMFEPARTVMHNKHRAFTHGH